MTINLKEDNRNYGIDIVKIIAMFFVALTHVTYVGTGFLDIDLDSSLKSGMLCFIEALALTCINLFVLSTGFLYYNKKVKYSRVIYIWIQTVFWSVVMAVVVFVFKKDDLSIFEVIKSALVISFNKYWYVCSYLILMIFAPLLNDFVHKSSGKTLGLFIVVVGALYSLDSFFGQESFVLSGGFSSLWLMYIFVIGATVKKYDILKRVNIRICLPLALMLVGIQTFLLFNRNSIVFNEYLLSYTYFTVFSSAIFLFLCLAKIKIKGKNTKKAVKSISAASFAVYLTHTQPLLFENFIKNKFRFLLEYPLIKCVLCIFLFATVIFVSGIICGIVQEKLFKLIRINKFCEWLEMKIKKVYTVFYNKILLIYNKKLGE